VQCPKCGKDVKGLQPIPTGMKVALEAAGSAGLPSEVCADCHDNLSARISQGARLRVEHKAREQNKMMIWKSRVNLIRQARGLMQQKAFPEAAVCYEKYLRIMEMVYDLKVGELSPKLFSNSARSKELTVVANVYWDLMRIYDTSPRYGKRMESCALKLAEFLPFSTVYPDVTRKAESFMRNAKNPEIVRTFLKQTKKQHGKCFVVTLVFRAPNDPTVISFRAFRDRVLKKYSWGRRFVCYYYKHSPELVSQLEHFPRLVSALRPPLRVMAYFFSFILKT
jgi:hypothetical protein